MLQNNQQQARKGFPEARTQGEWETKPTEENHGLQSRPKHEQDQSLLSEKPQVCRVSQEDGSPIKKYKNCGGTFCVSCSHEQMDCLFPRA